jgi:hypothetical protein
MTVKVREDAASRKAEEAKGPGGAGAITPIGNPLAPHEANFASSLAGSFVANGTPSRPLLLPPSYRHE